MKLYMSYITQLNETTSYHSQSLNFTRSTLLHHPYLVFGARFHGGAGLKSFSIGHVSTFPKIVTARCTSFEGFEAQRHRGADLQQDADQDEIKELMEIRL